MELRVGGLKKFVFAMTLALVAPAVSAAVLVAATGMAAAQSAATIVVQGNKRVDAETIRSYFQVRPGERLDAAKIDEGLKALYATGLYEDVRISQSGGRLTVIVVENLTINRVVFEGNKKINNDALAAEVQSRARGALSRPTVQADVQRIIEVYRRQGQYTVRVDPKIIERPNNRVDLVFEIKESDRTTIKKIVFVGNKHFSDWKLRDVITTGQSHWLSFLSNSDVYDPDRVNADQELLRRFYLKNGYADFRILSATVDLDPSSGGFILTFTVEEGEQYRLGSVEILSNLRDADPAALRGLLRSRSGAVYNAELVEKSLEQITIELSKRGYAFAQVRPRGDRDVAVRRINLSYVIEEGPRVYIERINIRGNIRTRDWVIRREFDLHEGDPYNRVLVDRAERRLKNLGYFKTVKITNEPGSASDRVIVNVLVEEQLTGEFSVAGGYSSQDGLLGEVGLGEKNFMGRGQYVRVTAGYGQRIRSAQFSFTEPFFLGYRISAGFDIYSKTQLESQYVPYDVQTTGGTLRAAFPLRENLTFGVKYTAFQRDIDISSTSTLPVAFLQLEGSTITSLVGYWFTYNALDNNINPTTGHLVSLSQDIAGLGGDVRFVRTTVTGSIYHPLTSDLTAMLKVQGGHITGWGGEQLRITDHFFHGPTLVRGFAPSGIGPRDSITNDALGGSLYWGSTAELQFPLPFLPKEIGLRGAVFADAGSLWDYTGTTTGLTVVDSAKIRTSVGVSFIWSSPFGPLRFDYGFPLTKESYDKVQPFRFGAGTRF